MEQTRYLTERMVLCITSDFITGMDELKPLLCFYWLTIFLLQIYMIHLWLWLLYLSKKNGCGYYIFVFDIVVVVGFFLFFWCDQKYLILFVIDCCTHSEPIKILSQHNLLLMCLCCSAKKNSLELSYSFFFLIVKKEMAKEIEGE